MLIDIRDLLDALSEEDDQKKVELLTRMVLESLANYSDSTIMTDLMVEMLQRNAHLYRELKLHVNEVERLSVTDQLTGIFNRRKFLEVLKEELKRKYRYDRIFSIIMFDIDHYKHVNDTFGHDVGDMILQKLAKLVSNRLRSADTLARWGGEEFMILTPETDIEDAYHLAESLRVCIENADFTPAPSITCSFGVASITDEGLKNIADLTKAVDEAMYYAKSSGRNQVALYSHSRLKAL